MTTWIVWHDNCMGRGYRGYSEWYSFEDAVDFIKALKEMGGIFYEMKEVLSN